MGKEEGDVKWASSSRSTSTSSGTLSKAVRNASSKSNNSNSQLVDCIEGLSIYSFSSLEGLNQFVKSNKLLKHDEVVNDEDNTNDLKLQSQKSPFYKYNTRSKLAKKDQKKTKFKNDDEYLTKLDDNFITNKNSSNKNSEESNRSSVIWKPTINKVSNSTKNLSLPECGQKYCQLGCICESILNTGSASQADEAKKSHCGRIECMFECNCTRKLRSSTRLLQEPSKDDTFMMKQVVNEDSSQKVNELQTRKSQRVKEFNKKTENDFVYYTKPKIDKQPVQLKKSTNKPNKSLESLKETKPVEKSDDHDEELYEDD